MARLISITAIVGTVLLASMSSATGSVLTGSAAARILAETREAWSAGDSQRVAELVEFAPKDNDTRGGVERAQELCGTERGRQVSALLEGLTYRSMDQYVCAPSPSCECPPDAVRVIFEKAPPAGVASRRSGPHLEVWAFTFLQKDGRWKWYWRSGIVPWHPWNYAFDTAEAAYASVLRANDARDYLTVHEVIEPDELPGQLSLEAWLAAR